MLSDPMRLIPTCLIALMWLLSVCGSEALALPAQQNNEVLLKLVAADQADRASVQGKVWDKAINEKDAARRAKALTELREGRVITSSDHYCVALLFQHGDAADDFRLAHSMAWTAYVIAEPDSIAKQEAAWLSSAAWDRLMLKLGKKQWYGTQLDRATRKVLPFDPEAVTKEERIRFAPPKYQ